MIEDNEIGKNMLVCKFCNQEIYPDVSIRVYLDKPRLLRPTPIVQVYLCCPKCDRILATTYNADTKREYRCLKYTEYVGRAKIMEWKW